ncbi:MAG: c-type cytochrome domain-containing protein [Bacteroidota bacterium]
MMKKNQLHIQIIGSLLMLLQALMIVMSLVSLQGIPLWLQQIGHLHPVLLHLPIAFIILLLPLSIIFKKGTEQERLLISYFLHYTALFATITALMGLLSAASNEYDPDLLTKHKWLSISTAVLSHALVYIHQISLHKRAAWISSVTATVMLMFVGSHFGGSLTHGEDYLSFGEKENKSKEFKPITDSTVVYNDVVQTILINKCIECHNEQKQKGGLDLTSFASFQKGGKTGNAFINGDPEQSLFIQRALLTIDDRKHMPPKGKLQLTSEEIFLFKEWTRKKADTLLTFHQIDQADTLRSIIEKIVNTKSIEKTAKQYPFSKAADDKIQSLNSPFRRIMPVDIQSPALVVKFYLKEKFSIQLLEECSAIAKQVIEINLSSMPADDGIFKHLSKFENLEKLNLNGTLISGKELSALKSNKKLESIYLANTSVGKNDLEVIGKLPSVKSVYLWNSKVTDKEAVALNQKYNQIKWDIGYVPDEKELLKLTPPSTVNAEKMILDPGELVQLKHPLPGAQIRYTIDGSAPDSMNGLLYSKPFSISGLTQINAIAVSNGWLSSNPSTFTYFLKGAKADSAVIINKPADRYRANGSIALIDFNKGTPTNLNLNWLGFRDETMKAAFHFSHPIQIKQAVLSIADNTGAYVFPPQKIIVKGGNSKSSLRVIGTVSPVQPIKQRNAGIIPVTVQLAPGIYPYVEIEAINVQRLPNWHPGKKEKAWVFVDEVFFY